MRGATVTPAVRAAALLFQSTHPVRGATTFIPQNSIIQEFQSTHPVRGATASCEAAQPLGEISIHAPRAGCDEISCPAMPTAKRFQSTHPVRGATSGQVDQHAGREPFQSTHPVRGATVYPGRPLWRAGFQSTHPVRGATAQSTSHRGDVFISIHAPRAGCDHHLFDRAACPRGFQSTHPVRGATPDGDKIRAGKGDFNPRTPCGVRRGRRLMSCATTYFNPRTPCGVRPKWFL